MKLPSSSIITTLAAACTLLSPGCGGGSGDAAAEPVTISVTEVGQWVVTRHFLPR